MYVIRIKKRKWDIIGKRRGKEMVFRFCELHVGEHNNGSFYLRQRGKGKCEVGEPEGKMKKR